MSIPYKITSTGQRVLKHDKSPEFANISAIIKKNDDQRKYMLANEIVSLSIAQYLHLPVPPAGVAIESNTSLPYLFSIELLPEQPKQSLKPNPAKIVQIHPELSWSIILFDILMINKDRKPRNLIYDKKHDKLYIFDHGNCIYGAAGRNKVINHKNVIGIGDHCLVKNINTLDGYSQGLKIIQEMPDSFISRSVKLGAGIGYSDDDCTFITQALIARKRRISEFLSNQRDKFLAMNDDLKKAL